MRTLLLLLLTDRIERNTSQSIRQDILISCFFLCMAYCFIALLGGIKVLLRPTFLFFTSPPESSFASGWRLWDSPWDFTRSDADVSSLKGGWQSVGMTRVWRSLSWANLHLIPNLHFPFFLYDTHILLPPIWEGLACIVRGTCFCKALRFCSAWALKGLANTLLSEQLFSEGGGSLLCVSEPNEGAGRLVWQIVWEADTGGCVGDEEGSGSLSDSL